jgi:hypothetical protein
MSERTYVIGVPLCITIIERDDSHVEVRLDVDLTEAAGRDLEGVGFGEITEADLERDLALIEERIGGIRNNLSVNL